jgi:hypothetical protein
VPAGSTSVSFPITIIDNDRIEGPISVGVSAQVDNWTGAVRSTLLVDDESADISLQLPPAFSESSGVLSSAGVISLHGTAISNLVIYLSSLNEDKVSVPAAVLLPAGQSNATFDLTAVNDSIADGNQEVMIFANASEFASAAATVTVWTMKLRPRRAGQFRSISQRDNRLKWTCAGRSPKAN